jgi:hypothetical protein
MVALPLKLTRPRKSRNQPLAFKPYATLTIAFDPYRSPVSRGVSRFRVGSNRQRDLVRAFLPRHNAALFQLCFVREEKRFRRRTLLGRTIAKD